MYKYRDPYIIDFTGVKYYLQVHEIIKEALDFPDYYGKNWDAFWDCLTDMVGEPLHIEIYALNEMEKKFPGTSKMILECLADLKHYNNGKYAEEICIRIIDGNTERIL